MLNPVRPALRGRTAQVRRRVRLAGPLGWLVGVFGPAVPAAVVAAVPSAEVLPGILFLVTVIGVTVLAGRGPGLVASVVSNVTLVGLVAARTPRPAAHLTGWWGWIGVFLGLCLLVVIWLDRLLADAAQRATVMLAFAEQHRHAQLERDAEQLRATARLSNRLLISQRIARLAGFESDFHADKTTWSDELCRMVGRTTHPADQAEAWSHMHPDEIPGLLQLRKQIIADGAPFRVETRLIHQDGGIREVVLYGEAMRADDDPHGEVVGLWGVFQDVTDANAAQRKAAVVQRAMEQAQEEALAERRVLTRLQQALLPRELPDVPGAILAADYIAVADRIDIGGDWYDAFALPDGRIALSIGDVMGHDLQAAAIMGQVRACARGYAVTDADPGSVLTRLNRLLSLAYPGDLLISAVAGLYDPDTGLLQWANAGHPPPLLAHPAAGGAQVTVLEDAQPILGLLNDAVYPTQQVTLPERGTLFCYTDGLVEHHTGDPQAGEATLHALLADAHTGPEPMPAEQLICHLGTAMRANGPPEDDVCILVLQRGISPHMGPSGQPAS